MRLVLKKNESARRASRKVKQVRVRKKVVGTSERPRLCVFRSSKHVFVQLIDDQVGNTLVSASSLGSQEKLSGKDVAKKVGAELAKKALSKGIQNVVFDRNGFVYHGRVEAVAIGAREAGLKF
jgi:large subunit ribosomal protein L18